MKTEQQKLTVQIESFEAQSWDVKIGHRPASAHHHHRSHVRRAAPLAACQRCSTRSSR